MKRVISVILFLGLAFLGGSYASAADKAGEAAQGYLEPIAVDEPIVLLAEPPPLTKARKQAMEDAVDRHSYLEGPRVPQTGVPEPPARDTETIPRGAGTMAPLAVTPGTFQIDRKTDLGGLPPAGFKSVVDEPSAATAGKFVFYTGNWYAARSTDGGKTFGFIDPFAGLPDFCCDQDVIYDPGRDMHIWFRQTVASTTSNTVRIGVTKNGGATFTYYDFTPVSLNAAWTNQWFDYPRIVVSNNYLWVASNMFSTTGAQAWTRTFIIRLNLDDMFASEAVSWAYFAATDVFNFTPVQGATTTMYWGTHVNTTTLRIFRWDEVGTTILSDNVTIPSWTSTPRGSAICTTADGFTPCARFDDRIMSGWLANWDGFPGEKMIGFFWNVKQSAGFLKPYTNAALFRERDRSYVARPFIRSDAGAWIYADGAPNGRGNLGVSLNYVSNYPHLYAAIDDDFNGAPPSWETKPVQMGTNGPSQNKWGDYNRARPHYPAGLKWIATGHVLIGGTLGDAVSPRYVLFGRSRDSRSLTRWLVK